MFFARLLRKIKNQPVVFSIDRFRDFYHNGKMIHMYSIVPEILPFDAKTVKVWSRNPHLPNTIKLIKLYTVTGTGIWSKANNREIRVSLCKDEVRRFFGYTRQLWYTFE